MSSRVFGVVRSCSSLWLFIFHAECEPLRHCQFAGAAAAGAVGSNCINEAAVASNRNCTRYYRRKRSPLIGQVPARLSDEIPSLMHHPIVSAILLLTLNYTGTISTRTSIDCDLTAIRARQTARQSWMACKSDDGVARQSVQPVKSSPAN